MEDGQPDQQVEVVEQVSGGGEAAPVPEQTDDLATKYALLEERHKHSSSEMSRIAGELKELNQWKQDQASSLTTQQQGDGFPTESEYIAHWVKNDKTELEAKEEYRREQFWRNQIQSVQVQNRALANRLKFAEEERERGFTSMNPEAKEAVEFWKDNPVMDALPVTEKIAQYKSTRAKLSAGGRDLSAIKGAAGSSQAAGGSPKTSGPSADAAAIAEGFPCDKAKQEYNAVTNAAQNDAWEAKWTKKR